MNISDYRSLSMLLPHLLPITMQSADRPAITTINLRVDVIGVPVGQAAHSAEAIDNTNGADIAVEVLVRIHDAASVGVAVKVEHFVATVFVDSLWLIRARLEDKWGQLTPMSFIAKVHL